ncbi:MAG: hypothetical protein M0Q21_00630 [Ignavibacteriaceae bacterium]|nr:hypothetical protein [Ignavibacteriaceae bacterium]
MGFFDSKIVINVWCKSKFDKFDVFLLKLTSMLNLQSSIFNLQSSIFNLQSSIFNLQSSIFNLQSSIFNLQSSIFHHQKLSQTPLFLVQFLFSLNKMILKTLTKSRFAGNSEFVNFPQTRKYEHFTQNMRFFANFAGEGG